MAYAEQVIGLVASLLGIDPSVVSRVVNDVPAFENVTTFEESFTLYTKAQKTGSRCASSAFKRCVTLLSTDQTARAIELNRLWFEVSPGSSEEDWVEKEMAAIISRTLSLPNETQLKSPLRFDGVIRLLRSESFPERSRAWRFLCEIATSLAFSVEDCLSLLECVGATKSNTPEHSSALSRLREVASTKALAMSSIEQCMRSHEMIVHRLPDNPFFQKALALCQKAEDVTQIIAVVRSGSKLWEDCIVRCIELCPPLP